MLLLAAAAAVYFAVAMPLVNLYAERAVRLQDRQVLAQRLAGVAAELPALRPRLATLRAAESRVVVSGASDAVASAYLQGRIQELAFPAGATISSTETLPVQPLGAYHRIGVRVGVGGGYPTVVKLLAALEQATPPLVIDNVRILAGRVQAGQQQETSRVDASFEVYGFRSSATPAPAAQ